MQNLFRRPSGVWVARLAVTTRLRQIVGRCEFIQSTRTADPSAGKLIASALIAGWRRALFNADRSTGGIQMDLEHETLLRIVDGSPVLTGSALLPLTEAAQASGIGVTELLRLAGEGMLRLYVGLAGAVGYVLPYDALEIDDVALRTRIVPHPEHMPSSAARTLFSGSLALLGDDAKHAARAWLKEPNAKFVLHLLETGNPLKNKMMSGRRV